MFLPAPLRDAHPTVSTAKHVGFVGVDEQAS